MTPKPASIKTRIIQPLNDTITNGVDLNELLDKEIAKEAGITEDARPPVASTDEEKAIIDKQLSNFTAPTEEAPTDTATDGIPGVEINSDGTLVADAPADAEKPANPTPPPAPAA
jgi:hypothetical protein